MRTTTLPANRPGVTNFGRPTGRTAYLNVSFRNVTLLGRDITVKAHMVRIDGRKRYVAGVLLDGDTVTAEADALYIEMNPGAD